MLKKLFIIVAISLCLLCFSATILAQVTGGAVTGTIVDPNGAVVPNAGVVLKNQNNGAEFSTQSTASGSYNFPNIPVGVYTLTSNATGFEPATQEIKVALNQTTTVDLKLQLAGVSGTVEVTAASEALVQTDSSQLGKSFETEQVRELPIFGNQNQLAVLAPNVVERSAGVLGAGGSVGGTRPRGNSFTVDGVDNNDAAVTGPVNSVIQDAIQEFSLLTNNYNAEFGNGAGGLFNTITKSGTNRFSGSGFYYGQSEKFNALSTQTESLIESGALSENPRFRDHRYGFTVGGPIVKNKLFFFTAFERQNDSSAGSAYSFAAPTGAGLDQIANLPGASSHVVNILRQYSIQAPNQEFLQPVLAPGVNCAATPGDPNCISFGTASVISPTGFDNNLFHLNFDYNPNNRDQVRFRYSYQKNGAEQPGGNAFGTIPEFNNLVDFKSQLFSANWIRTIGASMVNDLRLSYRDTQTNYPLKNAEFNDFPNIFDVETGIDIGPGGSLPQGHPVDNLYQLYESLTYIRGNHSFKAGGEYRKYIGRSLFLPRSRGDYLYSSFDELISDSVPSFSALRGVGTPEFVGNQSAIYFFGQDDWKIRPNLTLNLGLRYEYSTLARDEKLQELNSIADVPGVIEFHRPKTDKNDFAPRIGVAYSPNGKGYIGRLLFGEEGQSSIRANFGVSYYTIFQNLSTLSLPPQAQGELNPDVANIDPTQPFLQNGGLPGILPPVTTTAQARSLTQARIPDRKTPISYSWTISYQRELSPSTAIEFRYLGTKGRNLPVQFRLNAGVVPSDLGLPTFFTQPSAQQLGNLPTTLGDIQAQRRSFLGQYGFESFVVEFSPVGESRYDSGSASLTRRLSNNLALTAAYTFSKTMDNSTNELNSSAVNPRRPQDPFDIDNEWGLSPLDVPHRFALSAIYEIPYFKNDPNKFVRSLLGGWQIAAIFQAQSGQPITPLSGLDSNLNGDSAGDRTILNISGVEGTGSGVRAVNANGQTVGLGDPTTVAYVVLNPNAQYVQAGPGAIATAGRNTLRSNGFSRTDMNFLKNFRFGDRYNFQIGAEFFDIFNQRPKIIGTFNPTALALDIGGLQTNTSLVNVASSNFNNYEIGDHYGRSVTFRAKFFF
ncbi:MAG: carboxypeptidase regulatory-like domain-containing protein [Pyrinomonadaceae bacterium]